MHKEKYRGEWFVRVQICVKHFIAIIFILWVII